jgi:hypothetical protein
MPFSHWYSWQIAARAFDVPLTCRLRLSLDPERLARDVEAVQRSHALQKNHALYHDGGWQAVGLVTATGEAEAIGNATGDFQKTEAFDRAPYIAEFVDGLACQKQRVRLMELAPGANVYWHRDHELDSGVVRVHVPVVTNPSIEMQICHQDCRWKPGEMWFGDFAFAHRLRNNGTTTRIHMVMDLVENDFVRGLFPPEFFAQRARRDLARKVCGGLYAAYNSPRRIRDLLGDHGEAPGWRRAFGRVLARLS